MFSYLVYSRDTGVYIRVWKTIPRLLYLDERCDYGTRPFKANMYGWFGLTTRLTIGDPTCKMLKAHLLSRYHKGKTRISSENRLSKGEVQIK